MRICLDLPHGGGNDKEGVIKDWQQLNYLAPKVSRKESFPKMGLHPSKGAHVHTSVLLPFLCFLFSFLFLTLLYFLLFKIPLVF